MLLKQQLFNKFIDLEFTREMEINPYGTSVKKVTEKISYKCPESGVKPNITIAGHMLPGNKVSNLQIKVTNFTEDIDLSVYKYIAVRAGYRNGPSNYLSGQIMNCYIEKPNPEGTTVFECVLGDLQNKNEREEVVFTVMNKTSSPTFPQLMNIVATACGLTNRVVLPKVWQTERCEIGGRTYSFGNILQCIDWLKNLTVEHRKENPDLPPLNYSFSNEKGLSVIGCVDNKESSLETVIMENVSSAHFWGGHMTIKAPWNPLVRTETKIQMPSTFFKGRMGSMYVKRNQTEFTVLTVDFIFGTREENSMTITATIEGLE